MNKFIVLVLVLITMSGCGAMGTMSTPVGTKPVLFLQTGVQLQVFNLCSQTPGKLYPSNPTVGQAEVPIPPGPPTWVPIVPTWPTDTRSGSAVYFMYEGNVLVGSVSRSFYVDRYRGTQTVQWIIGGNGYGGGQNVYNDRCPRSK